MVVIGYGLAGRLMGATLTECVSCLLELNAETVRDARQAGEPVFADATSVEALEHAHVKQARGIAVLINDRAAVERVADTVRRVAPQVPLLIRTRYKSEQEILRALGANEVIAEEVEASVEMLSRMLRSLNVPRNLIDREVRLARERLATSEREIEMSPQAFEDFEDLEEVALDSVVIMKGNVAWGRPVELNIREAGGALVIAKTRRAFELLPNPTCPCKSTTLSTLLERGESR